MTIKNVDASVEFDFVHIDIPNQSYHWNPETLEAEWIGDEGKMISIDYTFNDVNDFLEDGLWIPVDKIV